MGIDIAKSCFDAAIIAEYSKLENPVEWKPSAEHMLRMQQLQVFQDNLTSQLTSLKNQQESFVQSGIKNYLATKLFGQKSFIPVKR